MTKPFMHEPSVAITVVMIIVCIAELVIYVTLVGIGLYDLIHWSRVQTRQGWKHTLKDDKKRRIRMLSVAGLIIALIPLTVPLLLSMVSDWATFQEAGFVFMIRTSLYGAWPWVAIGLFPFTIGEALLLWYRWVSKPKANRNHCAPLNEEIDCRNLGGRL